MRFSRQSPGSTPGDAHRPIQPGFRSARRIRSWLGSFLQMLHADDQSTPSTDRPIWLVRNRVTGFGQHGERRIWRNRGRPTAPADSRNCAGRVCRSRCSVRYRWRLKSTPSLRLLAAKLWRSTFDRSSLRPARRGFWAMPPARRPRVRSRPCAMRCMTPRRRLPNRCWKTGCLKKGDGAAPGRSRSPVVSARPERR